MSIRRTVCNWSFAVAAALGLGLASMAQAATPIYVNAAMADDNGDGLTALTAKKLIQSGITLVDDGGTVNVAAGTYYESNISITKSLTITGHSHADTIIAPSVTDGHIDGGFSEPVSNGFVIRHSDVTIQNLTIDGNANAGLIGTVQNYRAGVITDYTSGHFDRTVVTSVNFKNIWRRGLQYYINDGAVPTTGNEISNSSFDNIGTDPMVAGSGYAMAIAQSSGTVSNNTITNCNQAIVSNFINQWPSYAPTIHIVGNHISSLVSGVWGALGMNLSGLTRDSVVENNTVDLSGCDAGTQDMGIILYWTSAYPVDTNDLNQLTLRNNQVTGAGGGDIGVEITRQSFGNPSIPEVAVIGNTVSGTGGDTGILVTDWPSGYTDPGISEVVHATLTGNHVSGFSTNIDLANLGAANVAVAFGAGNTVTDGVMGLRIGGVNVSIVGNTLNNLALTGQSGNYITLANNALTGQVADATSVSFAGKVGSAMTLVELYAAEDKIQHMVDDATLGLVRVKAANVYVTTNSGTIQSAIDVASAGDTINVAAGTYAEQLSVNKSITVVGAGSGSTLIQPPAGANALTVTGSGSAGVVKAVTLDGVKLVVSGTARGITAGDLSYISINLKNSIIDYSETGMGISLGAFPAETGTTATGNAISVANSHIECVATGAGTSNNRGIGYWHSANSTLDVTNSTITASHYALRLDSPGLVGNVVGSQLTGFIALSMRSGAGTVVNVDSSTLTGRSFWGPEGNDTGAVQMWLGAQTVNITRSTIQNAWAGGGTSYECLILWQDAAQRVNLDSATRLVNTDTNRSPFDVRFWTIDRDGAVGCLYVDGTVQTYPQSFDDELYVNAATGSDANNGKYSTTAFKTIQAAIVAAPDNNGYGIIVVGGPYAEDVTVNKRLDVVGRDVVVDGNVSITAMPATVAGITLTSGHTWNMVPGSSIQAAINAAPTGGTIQLGAGTYTGNLNLDRALTITGSGAIIDGDVTFGAAVTMTGVTLASGHAANVTAGGSIQAAINAAPAGGTVNVAAGTYNELVTVGHKGIDIRGAGAGNSIIDGTGLTGQYLIYIVETDGGVNPVRFHGFTLRNAPLSGALRCPVRVFMAHENGTVIVANNVIECASDPTNTIAINLSACYPNSSVVLSSNTINDCYNNSILVENACGSVEIGHNTINQLEDGGSAIYTMSYKTGGDDSDVTGRHWYHHNTITAAGAGGYGITVASSPSWGGFSGGKYQDVEISYNVISKIAAGGTGISLQVGGANAGVEEAVIASNTITSVAGSAGNNAITLIGPCDGTTIAGNSVSGFGSGVWLKGQAIGGSTLYPIDTMVLCNSIAGNLSYGARTDNPTNVLNASLNWWGAASGPGTVGPGSGDHVSANVTYSPWYTDAAMTQLSDQTIGDNQTIGSGESMTVIGTLTVATGTTLIVNGTLDVGKLDLPPGASIVVIGGELTLGSADGGTHTISGTFTIYNSFGSIYIEGDTEFSGNTLSLISDIHVTPGKTLTVSGALTLDGCVVDSTTNGQPFNIVVTGTGALKMVRTELTDANVTLNGNAAELRDNILSAVTINVAAGATSNQVVHNVFLSNVALNNLGTSTITNLDGWGNVATLADTKNDLMVDLATNNLPDSRTLDAGHNLYIRPGDVVRINLDVGALNKKISGVEAMLGFSTNFFNPVGSTLGAVDPWEYVFHNAFSAVGIYGKLDTAIGLDIAFPDPSGTTSNGTVAAIDLASKTNAADGVTRFYFRTWQAGDDQQADTQLYGYDGTNAYELLPFTLNTGLITVDGTPPAITNCTATQVQAEGSVNVFGALTHQGTVVFTVDAFDATAGIDTNDVVLTLTHATAGSFDATQTGTEIVMVGGQTWTRYTFAVDFDTNSATGSYTVDVIASDRSGNDSVVLSGAIAFDRQITATVQLQGAVTNEFPRTVTFVATDAGGSDLKTWIQDLTFVNGLGTVTLTNAPVSMAHLSAKTDWTLRRRLAGTLNANGQATAAFTDSNGELLGGDLNGDNQVDMKDFAILRYYWHTENAVADITGDGQTALDDFNVLEANWYTVGDLQ